MKFSVKIEGVQGVVQRLRSLIPSTNRKVKTEVRESAERIRDHAKQLVRVDTGRLRASIRIDYGFLGTSATVGSNLPYAEAQDKGLPGRRYSYTPYLTPAYNAEKERFMANLKKIF